MNLDTAQLRAFVTVAELKSFSKASQRLCRVQSAISQQIQRLEMQVGGELFVRDRKGLRLTKMGESLLLHAVKMLAINDQAVLAIMGKTPKGRLRIGTSDTYATCFLSGILQECSRLYPNLEIEVHCGYCSFIWDRFEQGDLDLAMTQCCPPHIATELLHIEPLKWVCSKTSEVYLHEPVPLALFTEGCADRDLALNALVKVHKSYSQNFYSTSHAGILAALSSGCTVSAILTSTAAPDLRVLGNAEGFPPLGNLEISMSYHDHAENSPARCFAEIARAYFESLGRERQIDNRVA